MKKIIPIIVAALCFTGCQKMLYAIVDLATPDPELSFEVNGELFKATDANTNDMRVHYLGSKHFSIVFSGGIWDTDHSMESPKISLNCGVFKGILTKDVEYVYTAEEMDVCPYFRYVVREPQESSSGATVHKLNTLWYNATDGWIKITNISSGNGRISGRFEFSAVCDDPASGDVIDIKNGVFKHIKYTTVTDY